MSDLNEPDKIEEIIKEVAELREHAQSIKSDTEDESEKELKIINNLADDLSKLCSSYINTLIILKSKVVRENET